MKPIAILLCLAAGTTLLNGCVSRSSTLEKGYGTDVKEKKIVWIWEKEYREGKK